MNNFKSSYEVRSMTLRELADINFITPRFKGAARAKDTNEQREYVANCMNGDFPGILIAAKGKTENELYIVDFRQRLDALTTALNSWDRLFETWEHACGSFYRKLETFPFVDSEKLDWEKVLQILKNSNTAKEIARAITAVFVSCDISTEEKRNLYGTCVCFHHKSKTGIVQDKVDIGQMTIPTLIFNSLDEAAAAYVNIESYFPKLSIEDKRTILWSNYSLKLSENKDGELLLSKVEEYYKYLNEKFQSSAANTIFCCSLEDLAAERTITLYELCCALAFVFYEKAPVFAIQEKDDPSVAAYKASELGKIFLRKMFAPMCGGGGRFYNSDNDASFISGMVRILADKQIGILVRTIEDFGEMVNRKYNELLFDQSFPSAQVFEKFITVLFSGFFEQQLGKISATNGSVEEYFDKLLLLCLCQQDPTSAWSNDVTLLSESFYSNIGHCVNKLPNAIKNMQNFLQEKRNRTDNLFYDYAPLKQDVSVLYSMFMAATCNDIDNNEKYEQSNIFKAKLYSKILGGTRCDFVDLGNKLFVPIATDDKEKAKQQRQGTMLMQKRFPDDPLLTDEMLDKVKYPAADSEETGQVKTGRRRLADKGKWEDLRFTQIRNAMMKGRKNFYCEYVDGREEYILETLLHEIYGYGTGEADDKADAEMYEMLG